MVFLIHTKQSSSPFVLVEKRTSLLNLTTSYTNPQVIWQKCIKRLKRKSNWTSWPLWKCSTREPRGRRKITAKTRRKWRRRKRRRRWLLRGIANADGRYLASGKLPTAGKDPPSCITDPWFKSAVSRSSFPCFRRDCNLATFISNKMESWEIKSNGELRD